SLKAAGIPGKDRIEFLQFLLEDETVTSSANIERDPALQFKALVEGPEAINDPGLWLRQRFNEFNAQRNHPHLYDEDDDGDEDLSRLASVHIPALTAPSRRPSKEGCRRGPSPTGPTAPGPSSSWPWSASVAYGTPSCAP